MSNMNLEGGTMWHPIRKLWFRLQGGQYLILTVGRAMEVVGGLWHEAAEEPHGFYLDEGYGQRELEADIAAFLQQVIRDHGHLQSGSSMELAIPESARRQLSWKDVAILERIPQTRS